MNNARSNAACTIFEGKLVVSGGCNNNNDRVLKSVEAYDHHENKWSNSPDMVDGRALHGSVTMGNKFLVL